MHKKLLSFFKKGILEKQLYLQIFGVLLICVWVWLIAFNKIWEKNTQSTQKKGDTVFGAVSSGASTQESKIFDVKAAVHDMGEWFTSGQILLLETAYQKDKSVDVAKSLMKQYLLQNDFSAAYWLLSTMKEEEQLDALSGELVSFVLFNYSISNKQDDTIKLELLSSPQKETYELLYSLADKNYSRFSESIEAYSKDENIKKQPIVAVFLQDRQTFRTLKDSRPYYYTGLLAVSLMKAGYTTMAMDLANDILLQDKNYILSYELLSQLAIKEKRYQDAISYLQKLMNLDAQHIARTAFFLGISYYYLGDYWSSITYLNQVVDSSYIYDALRYLILIHNKQGEYAKMIEEFRLLLTEQKVDQHDFALFFDTLFYEPYRKGGTSGDFSLARTYAISVVIPYIDVCQKQLAKTAPYICKYGEAWRYLSQNKAEKALKSLLYLSKVYPQPIIFQALWDYYSFQNNTEKATYYYNEAFLQDAVQ